MTEKQRVKLKFLKPKKRLRGERLKRERTTTYMAGVIGVKNRKAYEQKENGEMPFKDYEMAAISQEFNLPESELFF